MASENSLTVIKSWFFLYFRKFVYCMFGRCFFRGQRVVCLRFVMRSKGWFVGRFFNEWTLTFMVEGKCGGWRKANIFYGNFEGFVTFGQLLKGVSNEFYVETGTVWELKQSCLVFRRMFQFPADSIELKLKGLNSKKKLVPECYVETNRNQNFQFTVQFTLLNFLFNIIYSTSTS